MLEVVHGKICGVREYSIRKFIVSLLNNVAELHVLIYNSDFTCPSFCILVNIAGKTSVGQNHVQINTLT